MEGARMVDEWPLIERRVRSEHTVFRRLPTAPAHATGADEILDRDRPAQETGGTPAGPSPEEREVLGLIDGTRSVAEICERSAVGEFDTWRVLADLVGRGWIEEVHARRASTAVPIAARWIGPAMELTLCAAVLGGAVLALANSRGDTPAPWSGFGDVPAQDSLRFHASHVSLERVERAIRLYYLDRGSFPATLEALSGTRYLSSEDLADPWGRPYGYEIDGGGFRVFAVRDDGTADPLRSRSHRFTSLERTMRPATAEPPATPPTP
jgi:hypothetical protein